MKKRTRGNPIPLIVEDHPEDYDGYPFITLLQYRKSHTLVIVDNADSKNIRSFVLDLCGPAKLDEQIIIDVAAEWWDVNRDNFPLSIEFSRRFMTEKVAAIYRSFNTEYVTRVIGPLPKFEMSQTRSTKRRKTRPLSKNIQIINRKLFTTSDRSTNE